MLAGFASAPLPSLALAHFVNDSLARRASGALYAALLAAAFLRALSMRRRLCRRPQRHARLSLRNRAIAEAGAQRGRR